MNSSTIRTDGRLKMMPIQCQIAKEIFIENNCWDEVKEIAYKHFYNCSVGMFFQTDWAYKKAHYNELANLFKDMDKENIQYTNFKASEKRVLALIKLNNFNLSKPYFLYKDYKKSLKQMRRRLISIKWNKHEKSISIFGKNLICKECS